jgi:hypothetical protein
MHTYLLQDGYWKAEGTFTDSKGESLPASGSTIVEHENDSWTVNGVITLGDDADQVIRNHYQVAPFRGRSRSTTFSSVNPKLGHLLGLFAVTEDSIISRFISEDGEYSGVETMTLEEDGSYTARGALFHRDKLENSWILRLTKE